MNYMQQNMTKRWSIKKAPKKNSIQKYSGYERRNFDLGAKFFGVCKRKALNKRAISFQEKIIFSLIIYIRIITSTLVMHEII